MYVCIYTCIYYNINFTEGNLAELDKVLTSCLRKMFNIYTNTTVRTMFTKKQHGGLGIRKPSIVYRATRISFLVSMLNHCNNISTSSFCGKSFLRFFSNGFGIAPIAPTPMTTMLNLYPLHSCCIFDNRLMYFVSFSLYVCMYVHTISELRS